MNRQAHGVSLTFTHVNEETHRDARGHEIIKSKKKTNKKKQNIKNFVVVFGPSREANRVKRSLCCWVGNPVGGEAGFSRQGGKETDGRTDRMDRWTGWTGE